MYKMCHDIKIGNYKLKTVSQVKVNKSVETLSDIATIVLPGSYFNTAIKIEDKIKVGDAVTIKLGYDNNLNIEFTGYLNSISSDDGSLTLECIDGLYLLKKPINDEELLQIKLTDALNHYLAQINKDLPEDGKIKLNCMYDIGYDRLISYKSTMYNMLQKLQDDIRANIFFSNNTLNVCSPYKILANEKPIIYDFCRNIEKSELKYVKAADKHLEVEVKIVDEKGKEHVKKVGQPGGEKITKVLSGTNKDSLQEAANAEYNIWVYDGFEGSFTSWLIPFAEPTYKVKLIDRDYPEKEGIYYVIATETNFNSSGGSRKITLGRRLK